MAAAAINPLVSLMFLPLMLLVVFVLWHRLIDSSRVRPLLAILHGDSWFDKAISVSNAHRGAGLGGPARK
ncbi:MAG TPA: hypothetical protein DEO58_01760 [Alphaproteobacteria bacterium]|nr:hypothetical protein [Alphaproteobacteria bacterium]